MQHCNQISQAQIIVDMLDIELVREQVPSVLASGCVQRIIHPQWKEEGFVELVSSEALLSPFHLVRAPLYISEYKTPHL